MKVLKRKRRIKLSIVSFLALLFATATTIPSISMPGRSYKGDLPALNDEEIDIRANLKAHLLTLTEDIGERHLQKPEKLKQAADYLADVLSRFGEVEKQALFYDGQEFENIAVDFIGSEKPEEIILLGAHYDSVHGCPGANDNGSGVAAVLELARLLNDSSHKRTIRFVLFPNEEHYFRTKGMGSYHYAKLCKERKEKIVMMLALETIGYYSDQEGSQKYPAGLKYFYPKQGDFIAFIGSLKSSGAVKEITKTFREKAKFPSQGLTAPAFVTGVDWSDHLWFAKFGYPALMVTDTAPYRYPYYHTTEDTVDKINLDKTAQVVAGLSKVVGEIANR